MKMGEELKEDEDVSPKIIGDVNVRLEIYTLANRERGNKQKVQQRWINMKTEF